MAPASAARRIAGRDACPRQKKFRSATSPPAARTSPAPFLLALPTKPKCGFAGAPARQASAPTGRFCVALTYCSYHIFCVQRVCPHCGQTWTQFIPHENRTLCFALAWAFYRSKIGYRRGKKCAGRLGTLAQPLGVSVCVDASVFVYLTAPHHNRPQRGQHRVFPLGGVRMPPAPQEGHTSPHKG